MIMSDLDTPLLLGVVPESERPPTRYEVIAPVAMERSDEPFWLFVGTAVATADTPQGPRRIRLKINAVPHHGRVLQLGPTEGHFDLVLEPEPDLADTVPIRFVRARAP